MSDIVTSETLGRGAPPHRTQPIAVAERHFVLGTPMQPPFAAGLQFALLGMGCFWGAERLFWQTKGVHSTQVGYAGGTTRHPTYEDVCGGRSGHAEVVRVVFQPQTVSYEALLTIFWEGHDPTQGMRQGNDVGPQYRSMLFWYDAAQRRAAERSAAAYGKRLAAAGYGALTTGLAHAPPFYYAEDYHQQYLGKNPHGYCGLGGTGVTCAPPSQSAPR